MNDWGYNVEMNDWGYNVEMIEFIKRYYPRVLHSASINSSDPEHGLSPYDIYLKENHNLNQQSPSFYAFVYHIFCMYCVHIHTQIHRHTCTCVSDCIDNVTNPFMKH